MTSNVTYECINTANDCLRYWKRLITSGDVILQYVDPLYEYSENRKDYYRYLAWAETTYTPGDDY
jgi:hypothetical protein